MASPAVVLLFGLACAPPCEVSAADRAVVDAAVTQLLSSKAFAVRAAQEGAPRPTGATASPEPIDLAAKADVDRVIALDLEPGERVLWVTHFVRGFPGPWVVQQVVCAREGEGVLGCPELERVLATGLRPRRAEDVDFVAALRWQAKAVGQCITAEDRAPIEERIFGRLELDLEAAPTGQVRVRAIAPAHVARARLGQCLRSAMETMHVGAFDGEPVKLRIPIDLD
ncbi:hypothetical protein L6R52_28530 [Myxococcota bacterium]|nr:hypothetical protein [Myxococcota bacterium]